MTSPCKRAAHDARWGRVDDDGTVYVRTGDGERRSASGRTAIPGGARLLHASGTTTWRSRSTCSSSGSRPARCAPDDADSRGEAGRDSVAEAQAVGDLAALDARLDALTPTDRPRAEKRKAERAAQASRRPRAPRSRSPIEAEQLAAGQRLAQRRKPAARAARPVEGAAPDRQGRRRRAVAPVLVRAHDLHPPPQGALRRAQREARAAHAWSRRSWSRRPRRSSASTEWGRPPRAYRDLMRQWKAAGPAPQGRRRPALEAVPGRPGHVLRRPRRRER